MKSMPNKIKTKLRQLQNSYAKARKIENEVEELFEEYGVDTNCLRGQSSYEQPQTESLTFITYNEGSVEENIEDIEEIFLHYINKK